MSIQVKDKHTLFAFTVKDNRVDSTDYDQFFDNLTKHKCIVECKYPEYDAKGKLHYHGVAQVPKSLLRKKLVLAGLHVKLDEVYDQEGWLRYIKKDQPKPKPSSMFKKAQKAIAPLVHENIHSEDEISVPESTHLDNSDSDPEQEFKMPKRKLFKPRV